MAVFGGLGTIWDPVVGAVVLILMSSIRPTHVRSGALRRADVPNGVRHS
jgi:ABC-type branched-subunit amino acid transport system permease subunit